MSRTLYIVARYGASAKNDIFANRGNNSLILEVCGQPARLDLKKKRFRYDKAVAVRRQKRQRCDWSASMFVGSFFVQSRLDVETLLIFVIFFVRERFTFRLMRHELGLSAATFTDWSSFCREVMVHWALDRQGMIGGQGKIVEIDESKFGRRKYNVGRVIDGQWVFGGICRETRDLFLVPVEDRTSDTLLAVIKERIAPGSIIISDCWKAYNCLSDEGFEHLTVNHSYHFVDPDTQAHTNTIERQWREAKRKVPLCGRRKKHFAGYLARCMFLMHYQDLNVRLHHFLCAAASLSPVYDVAQSIK
nr:uncharacterized protein LOC113820322 [Penaeus vannamei]